MGISVQQYRAAIGTFHSGKMQRVLPSPDPVMPEQEQPHFEEQSFTTTLRGPWKLHALALWISLSLPLLLALMPSQRAATLLLIGGIEPHPGPDYSAEEIAQKRNTVIAELVVQSTSQEVTNVLRLYKAEMTYAQLTTAFDSKPKQHLVDTMTFLGVTGQQDFVKPTVISKLISCIQSYFPDHCHMCNTEYSIKLGETTYLECAVCRQGIHQPCLARKLGITEDELKNMTPLEVKAQIDPHSLPGLNYLCGYCARDIIPDPDMGRLKSKKDSQTKRTTEPQTQMNAELATADNRGDLAPNTPPASDAQKEDNEDPDHAGSVTPTDNSDSDQEEESESGEITPASSRMVHKSRQDKSAPEIARDVVTKKRETICRFFRKGNCRHGPKGEGCSFSHPTICQKLLNHGVNDKRGCKKGKSCKDFHPKMCPCSLSIHECLNMTCKLYHVKGTRRANSRPLPNTQQGHPNPRGQQEGGGHNPEGHQQNRESPSAAFLEQSQIQDPTAALLEALQTSLQAMKAELLAVIDTKLKETMPSPQQPLQLQQQQQQQQQQATQQLHPLTIQQLQPQMQAPQQVQMPPNPHYPTAIVHGHQGVQLLHY